MMKIEVLGTGCPKCTRLYANVEQAMQDLGIRAELIKIFDVVEIVSRGIIYPPALFINGTMCVEGRIPDVNEIKALIRSIRND